MLINQRTTGDIQRLRQAVRRERNVSQRDRLRAGLLAVEGVETLDIQRMLGRSRGTSIRTLRRRRSFRSNKPPFYPQRSQSS